MHTVLQIYARRSCDSRRNSRHENQIRRGSKNAICAHPVGPIHDPLRKSSLARSPCRRFAPRPAPPYRLNRSDLLSGRLCSARVIFMQGGRTLPAATCIPGRRSCANLENTIRALPRLARYASDITKANPTAFGKRIHQCLRVVSMHCNPQWTRAVRARRRNAHQSGARSPSTFYYPPTPITHLLSPFPPGIIPPRIGRLELASHRRRIWKCEPRCFAC